MGGYSAGNLRTNPLIYQMATMSAEQSPVVIMNDEGEIGSYNRANRSLHHLLENSIPFLMSTMVTFYLFPFPTFALIFLFCFGRIVHQEGYAKGGWGGHVGGFLVVTIVQAVELGLLIVVYAKMMIQ